MFVGEVGDTHVGLLSRLILICSRVFRLGWFVLSGVSRGVLRVLEYPPKVQECKLLNLVQYNAND